MNDETLSVNPGIDPDSSTPTTTHENMEHHLLSELPISTTLHRYGKVLGLNYYSPSSDWNGSFMPKSYLNDPAWTGASSISKKELHDSMFPNPSLLLDRTGTYDPPITFMAFPTGRPYQFMFSSHYHITEHLLRVLNGEFESRMTRPAYNFEAAKIFGKINEPYPYSGYDIFGLETHPFFWLDSPNEVADRVINPRFPVSLYRKDQVTVDLNTKIRESWGFPIDYKDAERYYPLIAKLLGIYHNKPYDWESFTAITSGFENSGSKYFTALKKLSFIRLFHDLRGKWMYYSTSPDIGEDMSFLGIHFPDQKYFQNGAKYTGRRPMISIDINNLQLSPSEQQVADLITTLFKSKNPSGKPTEFYPQLQKEISGVLSK